MICDRTERRVGGTSAPVFGGGIFILLPQKWLNDRGGRRRLRRLALCRADPAGQPSPALRLRRLFLGQRGCKVGYLIGGIFSPSRKNGLMIGVGRRRLRRSAFCRADPAGQPSPASRLRRPFLGQRGCKVGYLIGGILVSSRQNGFITGSADGGCAARLFVGLTLPGSPPPLCGSAAFFGGAAGYFSAAKRGKISGAPGPVR